MEGDGREFDGKGSFAKRSSHLLSDVGVSLELEKFSTCVSRMVTRRSEVQYVRNRGSRMTNL